MYPPDFRSIGIDAICLVFDHQPINQSFILLAMVHTTVTLLSLLMVVLVQQALANHMLIWSLPLNHQFILSVAWNKVISLILFATHLEVYTYSILFCLFRMNYVEDWHILNFCHLQKNMNYLCEPFSRSMPESLQECTVRRICEVANFDTFNTTQANTAFLFVSMLRPWSMVWGCWPMDQ